MADWFHVPAWHRAPRLSASREAGGRWLLLADAAGWTQDLAARLRARGDDVTVVQHVDDDTNRGAQRLDLTSAAALDQLLGELAGDAAPRHVVHLATLGLEAPEGELLERGFYSLLHLGRALGRHCLTDEVDVTFVSDGLAALGGVGAVSAAKAAALGPLRVIPQEIPNLRCRAIDLPDGGDRGRLVDALLTELTTPDDTPVVALRPGGRWIEGFVPLRLPEPTALPRRLRRGGTYLITGGLGNIGLTLADYLHRVAGAHLVLTSRTGVPAEVATPEQTARRQRLQALVDAGAQVRVVQADAADAAQMERAFAEAEAHGGAVHGVIHAAGLVGEASFATVRDGDRDSSERQFRAKIGSLRALTRVLATRDVDFCLLCSSLSPILGGIGFSAYAAANLYLDAAAEAHNAASTSPWISVNWEGWRFDSGAIAAGAGAAVAELGLRPAEGCAAFARIMDAPGLDRVVVSTGPLRHRLEQWVTGVNAIPETGPGPAGGHRPEGLGAALAPRTATEQALAGMWHQLLGIDGIGAVDSFFELGGNSLMLTQLVALIRRTFQVDLPLQDLFNTPTVADIAAQIDTHRAAFDDDTRDVGEV